MLQWLARTISTFFYIGYLPFIPGTFGSLAGIILFYLVKNSKPQYFVLTLAVTVLGFIAATKAEESFKRKDPGCIVIDEVSGMLISFIFLPYDLRLVIAGFFLFRLLDTLKPYPAGSLQRMRGAMGIMIDDIIAGIYTNLILQIVSRIIN